MESILNHRASFNNIEHLMRSVQTAMENGYKHPWKDKMKGSLSFNKDDMSPIKTQIMRFDKEGSGIPIRSHYSLSLHTHPTS